MILLSFILLMTAVWLAATLIVWPILRLLRGPNQLRGVIRWSLRSWVCCLPFVLFGVLPASFAWMISASGSRPGEEIREEAVRSCSPAFESVDFTTSDGIELKGWFLPGEEAAVPMTVTHGLFRSRMEIVDLACALNAEGHPVLAFDLRNHGESGGGRTTIGYAERLDVAAALAWIRERTGYARPALLGISMGAVASLLAGAEAPEMVTAIIADSAFISLRTTVDRHVRLFLGIPPFPFAPVFVWSLTTLAGFDARQLDLPEVLSETHVPILLIYGEEDSRMPPEEARQLEVALPGPDRQLLFFEGAGHGDAHETDLPRYLEAVRALLDRAGTRVTADP